MTDVGRVNIYNAKNFICEYGALDKLADYLKDLGSRAWILGSKTSLRVAGEKVVAGLKKAGIEYGTDVFSGYPTEEKAELYADRIREINTDFVLALGGGRVLDAGKRAASLAQVPAVTIPTITATNAAYRRNSMIYDEEGRYIAGRANHESPVLVLADAGILQSQPVRYLNAGLIDTLARYYEARPYEAVCADKLQYRFAITLAEVLYRFFRQNREAIKATYASLTKSKLVIDISTAIMALCGIDANYVSDVVLQGFAHPFYNQATRVRRVQKKLHGEVIGFGILVQLYLEGIRDGAWQEQFELLNFFGFDYTLEDIGLDVQSLDKLVNNLWEQEFPTILFLQHIKSKSEILDAVFAVNQRILDARNSRRGI